tara:strand:- start:132 stop:389 length:258 start_codon:yes stop_codon:yes gene_type:complete
MSESIARLYNNAMKKLFVATFVSLLKIGCREEVKVEHVALPNPTEGPSVSDFPRAGFARPASNRPANAPYLQGKTESIRRIYVLA